METNLIFGQLSNRYILNYAEQCSKASLFLSMFEDHSFELLSVDAQSIMTTDHRPHVNTAAPHSAPSPSR